MTQSTCTAKKAGSSFFFSTNEILRKTREAVLKINYRTEIDDQLISAQRSPSIPCEDRKPMVSDVFRGRERDNRRKMAKSSSFAELFTRC